MKWSPLTESNRRPSPYHGHLRIRATSNNMERWPSHLQVSGLGGSGIASGSLAVVTTDRHHRGLLLLLWPRGAVAVRTASPSSIGGPAAIPNATATARGCGAAN